MITKSFKVFSRLVLKGRKMYLLIPGACQQYFTSLILSPETFEKRNTVLDDKCMFDLRLGVAVSFLNVHEHI
jgi:hypothetical protein